MKKQGLIAVDLDGTLIDTVAVKATAVRWSRSALRWIMITMPLTATAVITAPFCGR